MLRTGWGGREQKGSANPNEYSSKSSKQEQMDAWFNGPGQLEMELKK